jgi:gliding-associated putative ABC transporter substrate-binding component GldG
MPFSSTIDTLVNPLQKTILISSSDFSQSLQIPVGIELKEATKKFIPAAFDQKAQTMGVLLKGKFNSAFENRIKPLVLEEEKTSGESEMIVFSSGTIAENQVDKGQPLELGYDKWTNNFYFNKTFLLQSVHYLMGSEELLNIKAKSIALPRFNIDKVKKFSGDLKLGLLLIPLLILLFFGGLLHWLRIRKFGQ